MANLKIRISEDCPSCKGRGVVPNPDYNPADTFPADPLDTCINCSGRKTVERWVSIPEFIALLEEMEDGNLQQMATAAVESLGPSYRA